MANTNLFRSYPGSLAPVADATNEAGGTAYAFSSEHMLAQYAATGCLHGTFYSNAEQQLATVLQLASGCQPEFIARAALYAREAGYMKDMPAVFCAVLSVRSPGLLAEIFDRVINSPKMLRNFVQVMRSGVVGRKSLGTLPKRLILQWLERQSDEQLFIGSVGTRPSLADVIRMVHPKPSTATREALYAYLLGRSFAVESLPAIVREYEEFRNSSDTAGLQIPDVPFQMLTSLPLTTSHWKQIARNSSWTTTRMNLNTFQRHRVFEDEQLTQELANRLGRSELVERSRVFPYQLLTAFQNLGPEIPTVIKTAVQDAMEIAIRNIPRISGRVYILPDISSSMQSPVTGVRKGSTTATRCIDVAALVAASFLRRNPETIVVPFSDRVTPCELNPKDSVMSNAAKLLALPSGGTNCSLPLRHLNQQNAKGDLIVYVSDNESWLDSGRTTSSSTETMKEWAIFRRRNPRAKMVCIDLQPYGTTQAKESSDIVNIGGFSDHVFQLISDVAVGRFSENHWVNEISAIRI